MLFGRRRLRVLSLRPAGGVFFDLKLQVLNSGVVKVAGASILLV